MRHRSLLVLGATFALVAAGCGGDDDDTTETTGAAATDAAADTTAAQEAAETTAGEEAAETTAAEAADTTAAEEAAETTAAAAPAGDGEGALSIVAWPGYIEDGSTDPAFDWVTAYEEATGCEVEVKTAGTSDEMVTLMNSDAGYDLVTASGDASLRLIQGGAVQPVDISQIPSYGEVDERLAEGVWHTVDGEHYGTPYDWGPNVLMYNTNVFTEAPTSWNVTFEEMELPDGESNAGRVQAYDGPIYIADAALYLKATNPDLGIDDPYLLTQAQFDAVIELLTAQRALVANYWHDVVAQTDAFANESVVASGSWPYQVNTLVFAGDPVASTVPQEGATGWADTTMLSASAPHPNCAYMWMEHSLDPKVQADVAAWFGSVPAVPAACEAPANENLGDEGCATNGFDNFEQIAFWKTPTADCGLPEPCVTYDVWTEQYLAIQGS